MFSILHFSIVGTIDLLSVVNYAVNHVHVLVEFVTSEFSAIVKGVSYTALSLKAVVKMNETNVISEPKNL